VKTTRPVCGGCHEEIVGVVPVWLGDVPVCRNCAYSGSFKRLKKKIEQQDRSPEIEARVQVRSRIGPAVGIFVLVAGILIFGLKGKEFMGAIALEKPYYKGAQNLDKGTESCIFNLWEITVLLQNSALQWPVLRCPATGSPYRLVQVKGNTIVSCPNPDKHNVTEIRVSRTSPVPEVQL